MTIHLRLGGINIESGYPAVIPETGDRAYERAQEITKYVFLFEGNQVVSEMEALAINIETILRAVAQGHPIDALGQEIDSHTQIQELGFLIKSAQKAERAVRDFLVSDQGQTQWNNGNVQTGEGRIVNIAEQCIGLTSLILRMQVAQLSLRHAINVKTATTTALESLLPPNVISIVSQYLG